MNKGTSDKDNKKTHNGFKSIRVDFTEEEYERILSDNQYFKLRLNSMVNKYSDLFPEEIKNGYQLYGKIPASIKQDIEVRHINITSMKNGVFQIYPAFVMPCWA